QRRIHVEVSGLVTIFGVHRIHDEQPRILRLYDLAFIQAAVTQPLLDPQRISGSPGAHHFTGPLLALILPDTGVVDVRADFPGIRTGRDITLLREPQAHFISGGFSNATMGWRIDPGDNPNPLI